MSGHTHSLHVKIAVTIGILILLLVAWLFSREGFSHRAELSPRVIQEDVLKQLGLESFAERIPAPDFVLKDLRGRPVRLQDLRGKVVLLNFWATWCPSCRLEMPSMEALNEEFGDRGLVILAVDFRESATEILSFLNEHDISFPALLDENAEVFEIYKTWSLPTTIVIDKGGHMVGKAVGYRDWHSDPSKSFFTRLLNESV